MVALFQHTPSWRAAVGAVSCRKMPNELDEVVESSHVMLPKALFCKNTKTIFSISWWHDSSNLVPEGLMWARATAQNHQMSSMTWLKVAASCYQNHYLSIIQKQFFAWFQYDSSKIYYFHGKIITDRHSERVICVYFVMSCNSVHNDQINKFEWLRSFVCEGRRRWS